MADHFAELEELRKKVKGLEKEVSAIRDLLNIKDNWHSEIKDMVGKRVVLVCASGQTVGTLVWTDRYNICIDGCVGKNARRIYSKGAIEYIALSSAQE